MLIRLDNMQPWQGEPLPKQCNTAIVNYLDGRSEEITVEPYVLMVRHPHNIEALWSDAELAAVGLARPIRFVLPAGRRATGSPRYELIDNKIHEIYTTQPLPAPEPPGPTVAAQLAALSNRIEQLENPA